MYNIRSGVIRWQMNDFISDSDCKYMTSYLMAIVMFALFLQGYRKNK